MSVFCTPNGVRSQSPGSRIRAPWEAAFPMISTPKGLDRGLLQLSNPFGVDESWGGLGNPGCAGATLGWAVQPLRGKESKAPV